MTSLGMCWFTVNEKNDSDAGYIWCTYLAFLISAIDPRWLPNRMPLAGSISAGMAIYWGTLLIIQFTGFDRTDAPKGHCRRRVRTGGVVPALDHGLLITGIAGFRDLRVMDCNALQQATALFGTGRSRPRCCSGIPCDKREY
jgi:hypothetical protein